MASSGADSYAAAWADFAEAAGLEVAGGTTSPSPPITSSPVDVPMSGGVAVSGDTAVGEPGSPSSPIRLASLHWTLSPFAKRRSKRTAASRVKLYRLSYALSLGLRAFLMDPRSLVAEAGRKAFVYVPEIVAQVLLLVTFARRLPSSTKRRRAVRPHEGLRQVSLCQRVLGPGS